MNWSPRSRFVGIVFAVVLAQGVVIALFLRVEHARRRVDSETIRYERLAATPAPDVALLRPDGSIRRLTDDRAQTTLLHFWATWCPPCREEIPRLLALGRDLGREGQFEVIAVSLDQDWETVAEYFGTRIPSEVFRDEDGKSTAAYGVSTLPQTYVIDSHGLLRVRFDGARDWSNPSARELLEGYLDAP